MLGVFDGHSGSEAAEFAREKLLGHITVGVMRFGRKEEEGASRNCSKTFPPNGYASPRPGQLNLPLGMLRANALFVFYPS